MAAGVFGGVVVAVAVDGVIGVGVVIFELAICVQRLVFSTFNTYIDWIHTVYRLARHY